MRGIFFLVSGGGGGSRVLVRAFVFLWRGLLCDPQSTRCGATWRLVIVVVVFVGGGGLVFVDRRTVGDPSFAQHRARDAGIGRSAGGSGGRCHGRTERASIASVERRAQGLVVAAGVAQGLVEGGARDAGGAESSLLHHPAQTV